MATISGAITGKVEKQGKTNGRAWTRTTIEVNGESYSTLKPVLQNPGAYVTVEYEDGRFGHSINSVKNADPVQGSQNFTIPPSGAKSMGTYPASSAAAPSGTANFPGIAIPRMAVDHVKEVFAGDEILHRIANIENYLAQFDKKYLELFQHVAENLATNAATIQSIAGRTAKIELDLSDFLKEQAEKEVKN